MIADTHNRYHAFFKWNIFRLLKVDMNLPKYGSDVYWITQQTYIMYSTHTNYTSYVRSMCTTCKTLNFDSKALFAYRPSQTKEKCVPRQIIFGALQMMRYRFLDPIALNCTFTRRCELWGKFCQMYTAAGKIKLIKEVRSKWQQYWIIHTQGIVLSTHMDCNILLYCTSE